VIIRDWSTIKPKRLQALHS